MFDRHHVLRGVFCALALSSAMPSRATALDVARTELHLDTFATAKRYGRRPAYAWHSDGMRVPIDADTPYLGTAHVPAFAIITNLNEPITISFRMEAEGRTPFGERRTITLMPK